MSNPVCIRSRSETEPDLKHNHHSAEPSVLMTLVALMMAVFALTGCGSGDSGGAASSGVTVSTNTDSTPDDTRTSTGSRTGTTGAGVTIQSIEREVSRIRNLPIRNDIAVSYVNRDQLRQEMKEEMEKEYDPAEIATEEKVLKSLDLLPAEADLAAVIEEMLSSEIAGFYDDETKELKLVSETPELNLMNQVTLAHEVTHALQDQSFQLTEFLPDDSGNADSDLARLSLVEGDATLTEEAYTASNLSGVDLLNLLMGSLGASGGLMGSSYLENSLLFPYMNGLEFVGAIKEKGGWQAVDAAYSNPPQSTEQVMHPEKYFAAEAPVPVVIPDLASIAGEGWTVTFDEVLGEFDALEILQGLSSSRARRAAAGWGGGAISFAEGPGGETLMAVVFVWDSEADAAEFAEAMGGALEDRYLEEFDLAAPVTPVLLTEDGVWLLVQRGRTVSLVQAPDQALGERVAQAL
ncbi:MAG: hypothetical protein HZB44_07380 [Actinobacteria bacterium]|nr:hypothetical protein [Actinomycetota bacterium]